MQVVAIRTLEKKIFIKYDEYEYSVVSRESQNENTALF